jgi:hypothetical protein
MKNLNQLDMFPSAVVIPLFPADKFKSERGVIYRVENGSNQVLVTDDKDISLGMDISFTLAGGNQVGISFNKFNQYQNLYPGVEIKIRVMQAAQWLTDNPQRRKTMSGLPKFLNQWLITSQNSGQGVVRGYQKPTQMERVKSTVESLKKYLDSPENQSEYEMIFGKRKM